jgi:hypothetical protein
VAEDTTNPFAQILGSLQERKSGRSGVRSDKKPGKVSPTLTTQETSRYKKIFSIMKDVIDPGPEARKIETSTTGAVGGVSQMVSAGDDSKGGAGGGFNLGKLLGIGALAAGIIGAALMSLKDMITDKFLEFGEAILDFGSEVASDIGKLPTMAAKLAKVIPLKTLKFLPLIGSLLSFGFAWGHFKRGEYISGLWELVSGIANLFPGVGTVISVGMDLVKYMYEANAPVDPNTGKPMDFGAFLKMKAKEFGSILMEKIKEGRIPILSGAYRLGEAIGYFWSKDYKKGFETLGEVLPAYLGMGDSKQMYTALSALASMIDEGTAPVRKRAGEIVDDAWGYIFENVFEEIGLMFSNFFQGIKDWLGDAFDKGKQVINENLGIDLLDTKSTPAKKDSGFGIMDLLKLATPLGAASAASNLINDGMISKNGQVTSFNDQDDILAAKRGGPIDKMLDSNSEMMSELNDVNKNQLNVLISIRDGINMLVSKSGNGPSQVQYTTNPLTEQFYA